MKHFDKAPIILLCLFTGKLLILNEWSYSQAIVLLGLVAVSSIFQIKAKNEEVEELKLLIAAQGKEIEDVRKQNEAVKNHVSGLKLAQQAQKPIQRF